MGGAAFRGAGLGGAGFRDGMAKEAAMAGTVAAPPGLMPRRLLAAMGGHFLLLLSLLFVASYCSTLEAAPLRSS